MGANENGTILSNKEKIFLTGHTGFKGTWLTLLLEAMGHEVVGYSLSATQNSLYERLNRKGSIQEYIADIRDVDTLKKAMQASKPTAVVHMAAQPLVLKSYQSPRETFEINAQGTANVLDVSFEVDTVGLIGAVTTDKVYKNLETKYSYVETDTLEGSSDPYSASKVAAEAVISGWKKIADISGGPKIVTLRSGNVIGGGDFSEDRLIPDMVRSHISGIPLKVRNLESTRPWMHVLDSLVGYLKALNYASQEKTHEVFNFAPFEESLSVKSVIDISLAEWRSMYEFEVMSNKNAKSEANLLSLNSCKAATIIGWRPTWSQEAAIRSALNWWKMYLAYNKDALNLCESEIRKALNNE